MPSWKTIRSSKRPRTPRKVNTKKRVTNAKNNFPKEASPTKIKVQPILSAANKILKPKNIPKKTVGKKVIANCYHKDMWAYTYETHEEYCKEEI